MRYIWKTLITILLVVIAVLPVITAGFAQTVPDSDLQIGEATEKQSGNGIIADDLLNETEAITTQEKSNPIPIENTDEIKSEKVNLYLFHSKTCPHCKAEIEFLEKLINQRDDIDLHLYEVSEEGAQYLVINTGNLLDLDTRGVPITIIGETSFVGFGGEEATGVYLIELIDLYKELGDPDTVGMLIANGGKERFFEKDEIASLKEGQNLDTVANSVNPDGSNNDSAGSEESIENSGTLVELPFVGVINLSDYSLPAMAIVLGLLDGFNPCAMWALLFLISLLLGMEHRRKMWLLGTVFILVSGGVYFLFMAAWLNLFLYLGFIQWIRILVGLLATAAGIYHLYDLYLHSERGCKISEGKKHKKYFTKLKSIAYKQNLFVAVMGIAFIAVAVNMVEMVCSAGLPALYTQVLALSDLSTAQYYGYIGLYILFFMLDDLIIFIIAMLTLKVVGIETKYGKYAKLIGGIIMIIIGLLLLFKPAALTFA